MKNNSVPGMRPVLAGLLLQQPWPDYDKKCATWQWDPVQILSCLCYVARYSSCTDFCQPLHSLISLACVLAHLCPDHQVHAHVSGAFDSSLSNRDRSVLVLAVVNDCIVDPLSVIPSLDSAPDSVVACGALVALSRSVVVCDFVPVSRCRCVAGMCAGLLLNTSGLHAWFS